MALRELIWILLPLSCLARIKESQNEEGKIFWCTQHPLDWWNGGIAKFSPSNVDPFFCTHLIILGFEIKSDLTIGSIAPDVLFEENGGAGLLKKYAGLRKLNRRLKVGVSLESGDLNQMINDVDVTEKFAENLNEFLNTYGLDGVNFFSQTIFIDASTKSNGTKFLKRLKEALSPSNRFLSLSFWPGHYNIRGISDMNEFNEAIDAVYITGYDNKWDTEAIPPSALFLNDYSDTKNLDYGLNALLEAGLDKRKAVVGIAAFGVIQYRPDPRYFPGWGLSIEENKYLKAAFTRTYGFIQYHELCLWLRNQSSFKTHWDEETLTPYVVKGENDWPHKGKAFVIPYENIKSVTYKARLAKMLNVGGIGMTYLGYDDFRGDCGNGPFPLHMTAKSVFEEPAKDEEVVINCILAGGVLVSISEFDPFACSHISYLTEKSATLTNLKDEKENFSKLRRMKVINPGLSVMLVMDDMYACLNDLTSLTEFIKTNGIDGVNLIWEENREADLLNCLKKLKSAKLPVFLSVAQSSSDNIRPEVAELVEAITLMHFTQNARITLNSNAGTMKKAARNLIKIGVEPNKILPALEIYGFRREDAQREDTLPLPVICRFKGFNLAGSNSISGEKVFGNVNDEGISVLYMSQYTISSQLKAFEEAGVGKSGVTILTLNADDREGKCRRGKYPLINAVKKHYGYHPEPVQYSLEIVNEIFIDY